MVAEEYRAQDRTIGMEGTANDTWGQYDNYSGEFHSADYQMYHLTTTIDLYSLPVILAFGVPANLIAVLIFSIKSFRQASCGLYLIGKSISDTVFLLCTFVVWLERVEVTLLHTQGVCQIVLYLTYISAFVSVWFVVALTTENLVRIRYPFKVGKFCTIRGAKWCITGMVLTAFVLYCPVLWLNHVELMEDYPLCQMNQEMHVINSIYTYLDTVVTLILPSVTILVLLFLSFEAVWMSKARNKRMYNGLRVSVSVVMQQQITRMLSAVSVSFIIMALPSHIARVSLLVMTWLQVQAYADITAEQYLTQHVLQLLYYLTFSVSIITYATFSQSFRRTLCLCLRPLKTKGKDPPQEVTSNSYVTEANSLKTQIKLLPKGQAV